MYWRTFCNNSFVFYHIKWASFCSNISVYLNTVFAWSLHIYIVSSVSQVACIYALHSYFYTLILSPAPSFYCNTTHAIAMNGQVAAALKLVQTHPDDLDDAFPDNFPTIYLSHCVQPGAKSRKMRITKDQFNSCFLIWRKISSVKHSPTWIKIDLRIDLCMMVSNCAGGHFLKLERLKSNLT